MLSPSSRLLSLLVSRSADFRRCPTFVPSAAPFPRRMRSRASLCRCAFASCDCNRISIIGRPRDGSWGPYAAGGRQSRASAEAVGFLHRSDHQGRTSSAHLTVGRPSMVATDPADEPRCLLRPFPASHRVVACRPRSAARPLFEVPLHPRRSLLGATPHGSHQPRVCRLPWRWNVAWLGG